MSEQGSRWRIRPATPAIIAALAFAVLGLVGTVTVALTWPSLSVVKATTHSTPTPKVFTQTYWVKNTGGSGVTLTSVDTNNSTVTTVAASVRPPIAIGEGETVRIVMTYRVTDCAEAPEALPVNLRVDQWWGTQTITVQDHGHGFDGAYLACVPTTK
jgi:hypothetical protein